MAPDTTTPSPLKGAGLALLGFAVFSLHDALTKSLDGLPVFQIVFFVVLFSFVPFTIWLAVDATERSLRPRLPGLVALRCLFTVGGLLCVFQAFERLPLAEVYSLIFASPILITLLAIPILGEKVRLARWFAILLGLGGVMIVLRPGSASLSVDHLLALGGALCIASGAVITRRIGSREHTVTLVIYPMLANMLVCGVALLFVYVPMSGEALLKCALIGLLSVVGQTLVIGAYRVSEAQFVAPMQYSQMLWALIYGTTVFGESVDSTVLLGASVIVLSGLLFIWRELTASITQPVLRTRNLRVSGGPQGPSHESDGSVGPAVRNELAPGGAPPARPGTSGRAAASVKAAEEASGPGGRSGPRAGAPAGHAGEPEPARHMPPAA